MKISDLPDPNDRNAIVAFARSFNGYEYFGSFEACANDAIAKRRENLVDLQNELFWNWRCAHHQGNDGFIDTYRELLPHFRRLIETNR